MPAQQLLFVLGRERSGTTLLSNLLNNHSNIFIPPESPFISFLATKYAKKENISATKFVEDLYQEPYFRLWNIDKTHLLAQLQKAENANFTNFCKLVLQAKNKKSSFYLGDKNPSHSLFANKLHCIFPEAKFIWIIRDYRAQVNSMLKVNFEQKNVNSLSIRWKKYNQEIFKLYKKNPESIFLVRYEDLVQSPTKSLKEICGFLEVEFSKNLSINRNQGEQFIPEHHKSLTKKINTSSVASWKKELRASQIASCQHYAGDFGEKFGYQRINEKSKRIKDLKGWGLGVTYVPFIKLFQKIPLALRVKIMQKIIQPNFKFWQESKASITKQKKA